MVADSDGDGIGDVEILSSDDENLDEYVKGPDELVMLLRVNVMCIISQKVTSRGEKRDERRAGEREGATGVYERGFARDVFEI